MSLNPDQQLTHLRTLVDESAFSINDRARALALAFRALDAHLSAGGTPPEAWREGPDAPADSGPWGWQGDPRTDLDDDDPRHRAEELSAPEGLAVFAHWSASHDGINVEIDLPDEVPSLSVHVNDAIVFRYGDTDSRIDTADSYGPWNADGTHMDDDTLAGSPYFGA
jgi:hypothetical protein